MKRIYGIISAGIITFSSIAPLMQNVTFAQSMSDYYPNYRINQSRKQVNDDLVQIKALSSTSDKISEGLFARLNRNFQLIFPAFPQESEYKVVYQQCLITTQKLSAGYKNADFTDFNNLCADKISIILSEVKSSYTVQGAITASPKSGSAPLTVTLDARASRDPSNDTIPRGNYFWRFKDVDGVEKVIGNAPVINYTFERPGNYVVHLTVRSVNQSQGYFDGEASVNIDVAPQSAVLTVYANGKKLKETGFIKLGTTEAAQGVSFDGTATTPTGGRRIVKHRWSIQGESVNYEEVFDGAPTLIKRSLPSNGTYKVSLATTDNEGNIISTSYTVVVSDPVATIKASPGEGNTSIRYVFDGSASYSVSSRLKNYRWEIFDTSNNLIETFTQKQIARTFSKPGMYTIKLTVTDELGNQNIDQYKLDVQSTDPIPQFTITPTQERDSPSQFVLDASSSSDPDIYQGDQLSYEWKFDGQTIKTENSYENNKKVVITATEPKPFVAKLIVKDKYGKASELSKTIEVKSSVRPTLDINPIASVWGNEITMTARANKQIASYQWNFGDGNTKITNTPTVKHTYRKVGIYNVSLTVSTVGGETNTVRTRTFIGESNEPIVVYSVSRGNAGIIPTATCRVNNTDVPAFDVERYQSIKINAGESVNTKGDTSNLKVYFKPQNEEIYGGTTLEYKFSTLGCQFVDITVEDPIQGSVVKERAYFKVKNSIPKLDNLLISFPQYGNDVGIGFLQAKRNDPTFETMDPLIVKLTANGALDPDGQISYYSWYYYKTDNPSRILDVKITPGTINSVTFGISREAGEYAFGVKIVDNNEEGKRSEELIGQGPVIFLKPKGVDSNDIPIATLTTDKINAKVGEEITFKVTAKILSDRDDFIASRLFKYDFDGDGFDDLTTKLSEVKYSYTKPSSDSTPYQPKVKVIYRNKAGVSYSEPIIIKKGIIPKFIYAVVGKTVLMQDVSIGGDSNTKTLICMDMKKCKTDPSYLKKDDKSFAFTYPENGKYVVKMEVKDQFENVEGYREIIDVNSDVSTKIATIPKIEGDKISVGKTLDNIVALYAEGQCSIDGDDAIDSNSDGNKTNDKDYACGQIARINYNSTSEGNKKITIFGNDYPTPRTINVELIDNLTLVPKEYEQNAAVIDGLMKEFEGKKDYAQLYDTLSKLKSSLGDKAQTSAYLIDMRSLAMQSQLSSGSRQNIDKLIVELGGGAVSAVIGGSPYEQAKSEILKLVDTKTRTELTTTFQDLEANDGNKEKQATLLSSILQSINTLAQQGDFDPNDITVIKAKLCEIASAKDIPTKTCTSGNEQPTTGTVTTGSTDQPSSSTSTGFGSVVKIILIIVIVLVCAFILAVIFFAVRARMKQNQNTNPTPPPAT